jgi:hypothetical protein
MAPQSTYKDAGILAVQKNGITYSELEAGLIKARQIFHQIVLILYDEVFQSLHLIKRVFPKCPCSPKEKLIKVY